MRLAVKWPVGKWPVDWWLFVLPILLVGVGIAVIASVTYATNRSNLAVSQGIFAAIGIVVMVVASRFDYRNWRGLATILYGLVLVLLLAVRFFGVSIFGAQRWLAIGSFQLQPSELAKLFLIFVLARFLTNREELKSRDYLSLAVLVGLPILLVLDQPDLGTAIILSAIVFAVGWMGGLSRKLLAGLVGIGILLLPVFWQFLADYQKSRIETFLNPSSDPYGAGYNVLQALIAVGAGGMFGLGLGQGSQSQNQFLPVAHTDFIFAGVAEATGFVGASVLLIMFLILLIRIIRVAQLSKDQFGYLLAIGISASFFAQIVINVAMNLGLAPVTGIPLPFISHGGTALVTNFLAIGVLQSIVIRHKKITF